MILMKQLTEKNINRETGNERASVLMTILVSY